MMARKIEERILATEKQIEAAAKMLCYLNGIPECFGSHPDCDPPCTPKTCKHGLRDFGDEARKVLDAASFNS